MRRLLWVVGLPSGGTSLVAGMLHHLGVDMGRVRSRAQTRRQAGTRRYMGFECQDMTREIAALGKPVDPAVLLDTFRRYIDRRLAREGVQGVKNNALSVLGVAPGIEDLPVDVVSVERDVGDTLASDIKYRGPDLRRASWMGQLHLCRHELLRRIEPRARVRYEDALVEPKATAEHLALALDLDTSRVSEAADFVDPVHGGAVS